MNGTSDLIFCLQVWRGLEEEKKRAIERKK